MARLRKAARVWRNPLARAAAARVLVAEGGEHAFVLDPAALFGRSAPIEIELGAGRGDFIMQRAAENTGRDFLAVERAASVARLLAARAGRRGLHNLRVLRADARTVVNLLVPDASISAYHVYFPDPWPKLRHHKHRLFTPRMVESFARTLVPGGVVHVASDVRSWADEMFAMLLAQGFERLSGNTPGARLSGFGRKYLAADKAISAASFRCARSLRGPP